LTADPPVTWLLCDDRAGNRSQCNGVAAALGWPCEVKEIRYTALAKLPNALLRAGLWGVEVESKQAINPPWPGLVIAAGRRTAPIAQWIKKQNFGNTRIVQIMHPGGSGIEAFDLVVVPEHDDHAPLRNGLSITGAPHAITGERLATEKTKWEKTFRHLPGPKIALIVGGSTKNRTFTPAMAQELGRKASNMASEAGGSLLISTSRRTGESAQQALLGEIKVPSFNYNWGDGGENPYFGFLSSADGVIVTGDSMSMCSEACATTGPVYIYAPDGLITRKHARLHASLYQHGYARPLADLFEDWQHAPLNPANDIAAAIHNLLVSEQEPS